MAARDDELVLVKQRLYQPAGGRAGLRVMVHAPGAHIPRSEFEALKKFNTGAKVQTVASEAKEEPVAIPKRADLLVRCAELGVSAPARAKTDDLIAIIAAAEEALAAEAAAAAAASESDTAKDPGAETSEA